MAATETTLNKPAEHSDLLEQQVADVTDNNGSTSDTSTAVQKDAADILAILDSFGAQQPITDQLPKDAPLTAEEQDKLADLLGDTKLKSDTENKGKQDDILQVEVTENHGGLDKVKSKTSFAKQEQNKLDSLPTTEKTQAQLEAVAVEYDTLSKEIDGLLTKIQSQLEAVAGGHDVLSKELILSKTRLKELENNQPDNKTEKPNRTRNNKDIKHLRSELTKITKRHERLATQVQKLLKLAENSNADRENLEADLTHAHGTIDNLQEKVHSMQEKLEDYDNMVTKLRTRLVDKIAKLTTARKKLRHEVSQRRKIEQMLREIKSRLIPLTRCKSGTQTNSCHN